MVVTQLEFTIVYSNIMQFEQKSILEQTGQNCNHFHRIQLAVKVEKNMVLCMQGRR